MVNLDNATRATKRLYFSETKRGEVIERILEKESCYLAEQRKGGKKIKVPLGRRREGDEGKERRGNLQSQGPSGRIFVYDVQAFADATVA